LHALSPLVAVMALHWCACPSADGFLLPPLHYGQYRPQFRSFPISAAEDIIVVDGAESEARSQYGTKEYWSDMYNGMGDHDAAEYSWYYGWGVVKSHFERAVPDRAAKVLCPGIGNDPVLLDLVANGWTQVTAFDYTESAIARQRDLLSCDARAEAAVALEVWDATALPGELTGHFDAVLEKGALDAIYLSGDGQVERAAAELARVVRRGGVVVSFSGVVPADVRRRCFPEARGGEAVSAPPKAEEGCEEAMEETSSNGGLGPRSAEEGVGGDSGAQWRWIRDGSNDLAAGCFIFERL